MAEYDTELVKKSPVTDPLVFEACRAYGIDLQYVFAHNVREIDGQKTAVVVTNGGKKVFYRKGDKVVPLEPVEVDGVTGKRPWPPKKPKPPHRRTDALTRLSLRRRV